jgi:hypothetical protein
MKKILFLIFLSVATIMASAQVRFNAYGSYVFDDGFGSTYDPFNFYDGKINGGFQWGAGIEYVMAAHYCLELMYLRRDTHAPITYQGGMTSPGKNTNFDVGVNYILLGADAHMPKGQVEGYAGFFGGVSISDVNNPETGRQASTTKFAWAARLGANIWASDRVGLKLQAQLISSVYGGGAVYFGSTGVGLNTYSTVFQFGLGGGLTFKLGQ